MRTRLRTLHVGDRSFAWTAEIAHLPAPGRERCVRVRVWADKNGCRLDAGLLSTAGAGPWGSATDVSHPTPADIRLIVEHASRIGWPADRRGGVFTLTEENSAELRLEQFVVTDPR
ncbi:integrase [Herbihabitans rhizosphaerae]|uniref:integrase n=1 Tax=Herbihabitans rhizosphaerae TaxID=1872711 RepID=UPI00102AAE02|nr:integrase [Herbihabitans rhizosphaerae]